MDEFFNFEDAINPALPLDGSHSGSSPRHPSFLYDIDLILAQAADDDDSFNSLQHFDLDTPADASQYASAGVGDVRMGEADDFNDYSRWLNGAERSLQPCGYCGIHNLDCVLMPIDHSGPKRVCTNCTALSRQCTFSFVDPVSDFDIRSSRGSHATGNINGIPNRSGCLENNERHKLRCSLLSRNSFAGYQLPQPETRIEGVDASYRTGARFSRETVRLLRNWLSIHCVHPYPTEEEKEDLKRKTGLTKIQITNWLANARRRGQVKGPRGQSPNPQKLSTRSVSIPKRRKSVLENLDPLERWECSPPEHEPASVIDIAKAVKISSNMPSSETSPNSYPRSDDGSAHSIARGSSASSHNTSHSSHASVGSAFSIHSRGSFGSFGQRGRRRRRPAAKAVTLLTAGTLRPYQCTFCVETFKTKHDWQRHEKSLHLSLERWVCAPHVAKAIGTQHKCAFCGLQNPDVAHYEVHNYTICQERSLEERTFYRKDHLRQHLRLVHECQFLSPSMESWKIAAPQVRSRCGFCGQVMNTWSARVDHIAEHFKSGKVMADWKGSWGFDSDLQKLVENGTLPYLIHSKRMAVMSKENTSQVNRQYRTPYGEMKESLVQVANRQAMLGRDLTDHDLRAASSRTVLNYKKSNDPTDSVRSWFCELIMCPEDKLRLETLKRKATHGTSQQFDAGRDFPPTLDIDDRECFEKYCEFERRLTVFVNAQRSLGLTPTDVELKAEGCRILMEFDRMGSKIQSATAAAWFCEQIMASSSWTGPFSQRVGLPLSTELQRNQTKSKDDEQSLHDYQSLEGQLAEFVKIQQKLRVRPSDLELQRQARLIIFEVDDPFLQTPADDIFWLTNFKSNHGLSIINSSMRFIPQGSLSSHSLSRSQSGNNMITNTIQGFSLRPPLSQQSETPRGLVSLRDTRCYRRLELELSRFVSSCASKSSSYPYLPTDEEIRRQARWIIYNDDDPLKQTAADNEEWFLRFKRSYGLAPLESGPGMPITREEVDMHFGGTGLTPGNLGPEDFVLVAPLMREDFTGQWLRPDNSCSSAFPMGTGQSVPRLATRTIFASWKLESTLKEYIQHSRAQGYLPTDEQLRVQARAIASATVTSADDPILLQKFKELYGMTEISFYPPSTIDFSLNIETAPPSNMFSYSNTDTSKLTANWVSTRDRSRTGMVQAEQDTHNNHLLIYNRHATTPPPSPPPPSQQIQFAVPVCESGHHNGADPQLWGGQELLTAHLAGINMNGYRDGT